MSDDNRSLLQTAQHLLSLAGIFVAPATLITGLCYFFGAVSLRTRLQYFGIDPQTLNLTTRDYVVETLGVLFFAALLFLGAVAAVVAIATMLRGLALRGRHTGLLRVLAWLMQMSGFVCALAGFTWLVLERVPNVQTTPTQVAWLIFCSPALLIAGNWLLRITRGAAHGADTTPACRVLGALGVAVMVLALFWVTAIHAVEEGEGRATYAAEHLWSDEVGVIVDSAVPLGIPGRMVRESILPGADPQQPPMSRYECLRAVKVVGDEWVLVPAGWTSGDGYTVTVLPGDATRLSTVVHHGLYDRIGHGQNVTRFWQCPEIVPVFGTEQLDAMLLSPEDQRRILGSGVTDVPEIGEVGGVVLSTAGGDTCGREVTIPPDVRTRESAAGSLWMRQQVSRWEHPMAAADYIRSVHQMWAQCHGRMVTLPNRGDFAPRLLGMYGMFDDILTVPDSVTSDARPECAQSVAAKSNLVIEVRVCTDGDPAISGRVVEAIRDSIANTPS